MNNQLLLVLIFFSNVCFGQYFSGDIHYQLKIVPKSDTMNLDSLKATLTGEIAVYTITNNYYKSVYYKNDEFVYSYTYDDVSKRMFDEDANSEYITYRDSRRYNYKYNGSRVMKDSIEKVLDYNCFMVKYDSEYGKSKSFYSDQIKVDYSAFEGHKVGNWYERLKEVNGSIMLKTITEYDDYYKIREAIKIVPRTVQKEEFSIPYDKAVIASYSALDKQVELLVPTESQVDCYMSKVQSAVKNSSLGQPITVYLKMVVTENAEIKFIQPLEEYEPNIYKAAVDILENCSLSFTPGQINNEKVSSEAYFPINFK